MSDKRENLNIALAVVVGLLAGVVIMLVVGNITDGKDSDVANDEFQVGAVGTRSIENYIPLIRQNGGLYTELPIRTTNSLTVGGTLTIGGKAGNCEEIAIGSATTSAYSAAAATEDRILTSAYITTNAQSTATPYRLYAMVLPAPNTDDVFDLYSAPTLASTSIVHAMQIASSTNPVASSSVRSAIVNGLHDALPRQAAGTVLGLLLQVDEPRNVTCASETGPGAFCDSASSTNRVIAPKLDVCWRVE